MVSFKFGMILGVLGLALATPSRADSVLILSGEGTSNTGVTFSHTLSFDSGVVTLGVTNTSLDPSVFGLRITAVGLTSPIAGLTYSGFTTTNANFEDIYDFPMPPFPDGDFGASTSPTWLGMGAGHVADGLLGGESATFSWTVTGDTQSLTALDFANAGVYTRFKGLDLSDKVPGVPTNPVPEPSSVLLALGGLGAVAAARRRKAS